MFLEERVGTVFCLEPSFRLAVIVLPFGSENLYEPKECLLFTQKRYPTGVRLEDIEPQRCKSWIASPTNKTERERNGCRRYSSEYRPLECPRHRRHPEAYWKSPELLVVSSPSLQGGRK